MPDFPYVWVWRHRKVGPPTRKVPWFADGVDRVGMRCRVVARGGMNSALIRFEDGSEFVTSRGGIRRAAPTSSSKPSPSLTVQPTT